jgi:hypothetical protein
MIGLCHALNLRKPIFVVRVPETAYESLFEVKGTQIHATNDRHGLDLVAKMLAGVA